MERSFLISHNSIEQYIADSTTLATAECSPRTDFTNALYIFNRRLKYRVSIIRKWRKWKNSYYGISGNYIIVIEFAYVC